MEPAGTKAPAPHQHAIWKNQPRRNKRDIEDRIVLASRRAARQERNREPPEDLDYAVNDDDVDAWVHDGVDDIHIDPETKRAASEHSYDEKSIDAEYEPREAPLNRTRVTTIAEVIPIGQEDSGQGGDSSRLVRHYVPAAHLSLEQIQRLIQSQSPAIRTSRRANSPAAEQDF